MGSLSACGSDYDPAAYAGSMRLVKRVSKWDGDPPWSGTEVRNKRSVFGDRCGHAGLWSTDSGALQLIRRHSPLKLLSALARILLVVVCGCAPDATVPASWEPAIRGRPGPFASEVVYVTLSGETAKPRPARTAYTWHIPVCINLKQRAAAPLESLAERGEYIVRFEPSRQLLVTVRNAPNAKPSQPQSELSVWHLTDPLAAELLFSITLDVRGIWGAWVEPASGDLLVWGERVPSPRDAYAQRYRVGITVLTLITATGGVSWQREFPSGFTVLDGRYNPDADTCLLSARDDRDLPLFTESGGELHVDGVPNPTVMRYDVATDGLTSLLPEHSHATAVRLHPTQVAAIVEASVSGSGALVLVQLKPESRLETWPLPDYSDAYWVSERAVAIVDSRRWLFGLVRWRWTLWDMGTPLQADALTWAPLKRYGYDWSQFRSSEGRLITVMRGDMGRRFGSPLSVTDPFEYIISPMLPLDQESSRGFLINMRPIVPKFATHVTWINPY